MCVCIYVFKYVCVCGCRWHPIIHTTHTHLNILSLPICLCLCAGVLGKRTKFQERDVAQLVLQVVTQPLNTIREKHPPLSSSPHDTDMVADFPREVSLDDDTVLDKLKLAAAVPSSQTLEPLQQASLLGWW